MVVDHYFINFPFNFINLNNLIFPSNFKYDVIKIKLNNPKKFNQNVESLRTGMKKY